MYAIPLSMIFKKQNIYPNLKAIPLNANILNEQQFRLNKINEIKDCFFS